MGVVNSGTEVAVQTNEFNVDVVLNYIQKIKELAVLNSKFTLCHASGKKWVNIL